MCIVSVGYVLRHKNAPLNLVGTAGMNGGRGGRGRGRGKGRGEGEERRRRGEREGVLVFTVN